MKTTFDLNDRLLAEAKAFAVEHDITLTRLIEEGLQLRMRAKPQNKKRGAVRLPVFNGRSGLARGVNPLSNKCLFEASESEGVAPKSPSARAGLP
jgi:hypothetical protein